MRVQTTDERRLCDHDGMADSYPRIATVVLDTRDARRLAEFYRELFGLQYRESDEPPPPGESDDRDWLVLRNPHGGPQLAFQQTDGVQPSTWPDPSVPQMFHLDTVVATTEELETQKQRALDLGATLRFDRHEDPDEPLYVFVDPSGHPFCIFVG